eukprot:COSAG02_NODE_4509_length_5280_cov_2.005790_9_plen_83_part_00
MLEFIPASSGGPQQTFQMAVSIAAQLAVEAGVSADAVGIVAISWRRNMSWAAQLSHELRLNKNPPEFPRLMTKQTSPASCTF